MKIKTHGAFQGGWAVIAPQDDSIWSQRVIFSGTLSDCIVYKKFKEIEIDNATEAEIELLNRSRVYARDGLYDLAEAFGHAADRLSL